MNGVRVVDLGRMAYRPAYALQQDHLEEVLAARAARRPELGRLLLVEHDPVITVTRRPSAAGHLLAPPELLARHGVTVEPTDRGGDITYHGPGQIVAYPIVDLNRAGLRLHEYMRLLEQAVIDTCAACGVRAGRDSSATGVWVANEDGSSAKICAMGVRIRRWVSMHGLALNVRTNLEHFALIVPCGLHGRAVTSLHALLGDGCPAQDDIKRILADTLSAHLAAAAERADSARR